MFDRRKAIHDTIQRIKGKDARIFVYNQLNTALKAYQHIGTKAIEEKTGQTPAISAALHEDPNPHVLRWLTDQDEHAKYGRAQHRTNPRWQHKDKSGKTALVHIVSFSDIDTFISAAEDKNVVERTKRRKECIEIILQKRFPPGKPIEQDAESLAEFNLAIESAIDARNVSFFQVLRDKGLQDFGKIPPILDRCKHILSKPDLNAKDHETLTFLFQVIKQSAPAWYLSDILNFDSYFNHRSQYELLRNKFFDALPVAFKNLGFIDDFLQLQKNAIDKLDYKHLEYLCLIATKATTTQDLVMLQTQLLNYIFSKYHEKKLDARQLIAFEKIIVNNLFRGAEKETALNFKEEFQLQHLKLAARLYRRSAKNRPLFDNETIKEDLISFARQIVKNTLEAEPLNVLEAKGILQNILPILYEYKSDLVVIARAIVKLDDTNLMNQFISEFVKIKQLDEKNPVGARLQQVELLNFVYSKHRQGKLNDAETHKLQSALLDTLPQGKPSAEEEGLLQLIKVGAQLYSQLPAYRSLLKIQGNLKGFTREVINTVFQANPLNVEEAKKILQIIFPILSEFNLKLPPQAIAAVLAKKGDDSIAKFILPIIYSRLKEYSAHLPAILTAVVDLNDVTLAADLIKKLIEITQPDKEINLSDLTNFIDFASFNQTKPTATQLYLRVMSLMKPSPTKMEVQDFNQAVSKCKHDNDAIKALTQLFQFFQKNKEAFPYLQAYSDSYFHSRAARGAILTPKGKRIDTESSAAYGPAKEYKKSQTPDALTITPHKSAADQLLSAQLATEHDRLFTHDEHHEKKDLDAKADQATKKQTSPAKKN